MPPETAILPAEAPDPAPPAIHDGFVEAWGHVPGIGLLLHGWAGRPLSGTIEVRIDAGRPSRHSGHFGWFERKDVRAPAAGFTAIVPGCEPRDPDALRGVSYLHAGMHRPLRILRPGQSLDGDQATLHIARRLPALRTDDATRRRFRGALLPRYAGRETLSSAATPARAGIDLSARIDGAGIFVSGWLFAPFSRFRTVLLRSMDGFEAPLDGGWTRFPRPDISALFHRDPAFANAFPCSDDRHGFAAFVAVPDHAARRPCYIELRGDGEECAFLPVTIDDGPDGRPARRMLDRIDPRQAWGIDVLERHLGPMLLAAFDGADRPLPDHTVLRAAPTRPARTAVIMPVLNGVTPTLTAQLSQFGLIRMTGDEQLVLVCSSRLTRPEQQKLLEYIDFYDIPACVVAAAAAVDHSEALAIGAQASRSDFLLFLAASVFGREPGWIGRLADALAADPLAAAAGPTLLREDDSVKTAGLDGVEVSGSAPFLTEVSLLAGHSRARASAETPRHVLALDPACCLVRRPAYERAGGIGRGYMLLSTRGLDFCLRLRAQAGSCLWTPGVEVYDLAPGRRGGDGDTWPEATRLVDGWMFARRWPAMAGGGSASRTS